MWFHLSKIFAFLTLAMVISHAALPLPPQLYWNSVLPNTPMPESISQLVQADFVSLTGKVTEKFDFGENQGDAAANNAVYNYGKASQYYDQVLENHDDAAANILIYYYGKDSPYYDQVLENRKIFFLEKDIQTGTTMKYRLVGHPTRATFLSRKTADGIPFSSSKLPDILNQFSVKLGSAEAGMMEKTISVCEQPGIHGEVRYCATSLETMIDFITSKLGRNVKAISTEVDKGAISQQNYTITPGVKKLTGTELVACHKLNYPYAVFLCHEFKNTRGYMVPVKGEDGKKGKAIAVCHVDTSEWSPKHYAMRELKVKPGVPICHFLKTLGVAWIQK